ncbi:MAG: hypothetical protein UZ17_ACD001000105 [Acidobacteria bacterium OLB17]|nr:MAG: hypothetical protein UZ17_ACD001000105 [Acidobacteria bacterium OLB17]MCZ2390299.1 glycosyltransferase family 4 protein [Acidobacteriota bacterium]
MKVLALCSYPIESAASRFRLYQFVEPLRASGIELEIRPFLSSEQFASLYTDGQTARKAVGMLSGLRHRFAEMIFSKGFDAVIVQREAMLFGPAFVEWVFSSVRRLPMIFDLDDATFIPTKSKYYGRLASLLKAHHKADSLIRAAEVTLCGNPYIESYARSFGAKTAIMPTLVDLEVFKPAEAKDPIPVLGWIGTHSTYPMLETLFPVFERLAKEFPFVLRIVGSGAPPPALEHTKVENLEWRLATEVQDFQNLDIGLYPLRANEFSNEAFLKGKSGFKAIQYMAVGRPFVVTPMGITEGLGREGETHLAANSNDDWYNALRSLLSDPEKRRTMGRAGRQYAVDNLDPRVHIETLVSAIENSIRSKKESTRRRSAN